MGYPSHTGQKAALPPGPAPQEVMPGVFWSILSSTIHRNNLSLHPSHLGEKQVSPQHFLPFSGVLPLSWSLLAPNPCSPALIPSSQAPPTSTFLSLLSSSLPLLLLRNPVPLPPKALPRACCLQLITLKGRGVSKIAHNWKHSKLNSHLLRVPQSTQHREFLMSHHHLGPKPAALFGNI